MNIAAKYFSQKQPTWGSDSNIMFHPWETRHQYGCTMARTWILADRPYTPNDRTLALQWRPNERYGFSIFKLNRLFGRR